MAFPGIARSQRCGLRHYMPDAARVKKLGTENAAGKYPGLRQARSAYNAADAPTRHLLDFQVARK